MPGKKFPNYTHHKPSNRGRVRIDGKDVYLEGEYNSEESVAHYESLKKEWLLKQSDPSKVQLTVADIAILYIKHAESYYVKDGEPTSEVESIRAALRLLIKFHRRTRAAVFGPKKFKAFRDALIHEHDQRFKKKTRKLSRQYINKTLRRIVRAFKWASSEELIESKVWKDLTTVEGLKKGRCGAREARKTKPVPNADVAAVLPFLSPPVAAMVALQRATGMRSGKVVQMRPCDVTRRTDGLWAYRPPRWKTEHHDDDAWLRFADECSGAILKTFIFSPRPLQPGSPSRCPAAFSPGFYGVGLARPVPHGQRRALGIARRPADAVRIVALRIGDSTGVEPAPATPRQRRRGAFQSLGEGLGRTGHCQTPGELQRRIEK